MLDIKKIIEDKSYRTERWEQKIRSMTKENYFLLFFMRLFEYVYLNLFDRLRVYLQLDDVLDGATLQGMIFHDLLMAFKPMLMRVCIFELHLAKKNKMLMGETAEERFDSFIYIMRLDGAVSKLLDKYKKLHDLMGVFIVHYLNAQFELLIRLNNDLPAIKKNFLSSKVFLTIKSIERGAGDTHRQKRSVSLITFSVSGDRDFKLLYKPRSLGLDKAFLDLLTWFNRRSDIDLLAPEVLARNDYGWCQYISAKSCHHMHDVKQFYKKQGALLAIVYLLAGSDIHYENVIAHGKYPVIIDFECLLQPILDLESNQSALERFLVNHTHFLPIKNNYTDSYEGVDMSAFGASDGQFTLYEGLQLVDVGRDTMYMVRKRFPLGQLGNQPKLHNEVINGALFFDTFIEGFEQAYRVLLMNRNSLFEKKGPLAAFITTEVRVVLRSTSEYGKLLGESYHPQLMSEPAEYVEHIEWLKQDKNLLPLFASELRDLDVGDVPVFTCFSDQHEIYDSCFEIMSIKTLKTGYQRMLDHATSLSLRDLAAQKNIIAHSFSSYQLNKTGKIIPFTYSFSPDFLNINNSDNIKKSALQVVKKQLEQLSTTAIQTNQKVFWPATELVFKKWWVPGFTNYTLYSGLAGTTLVYAYAAFIVKDESYRVLLKNCLDTLLVLVDKVNPNEPILLGAFSGISGLLYVFCVIQKLFPEINLNSDIQKILALLPSAIQADRKFDVVDGVAGCLGVLFNVKEIIGNEAYLKLANECAHHILSFYPTPSFFPKEFDSSHFTQPQIGFAHGVAGIAWSLNLFNSDNLQAPISEWITSALTYERSCFSSEQQNWPDFLLLSQETKKIFMTQWCYGAAGIGMAREDMRLKGWRDDYLDEEISIARKTTLKEGFGRYHSLCHGDLGNLEVLLSDKNEDKQFWSHAGAVVQALQSDGIVCNELGRVLSSSLMTGNAGVAYQMMRIAHPEIVPNVLLLEI